VPLSNPSITQIKPEIWYHVTAVYDGSAFRIYLDGELAGTSEEKVSLPNGQKDMYIGSCANGKSYGFDGIIDEVKVYDYPRSNLQILNDSQICF